MRKFNSIKTNRICQNAWETLPNNKFWKIINYNKINRFKIEIEFSIQSILIFLFSLWSGWCFDNMHKHIEWLRFRENDLPQSNVDIKITNQSIHNHNGRFVISYLRIWFGILSASALICVCSFSWFLWFFVSVCFSIFRHSLDNSGEDMSK